ncbi:hypothetical protein QZH56_35405 [Streptomyces olivoreticuli]|uniref:hypothetical protein n=1 Tax=Streptomyces olivoreticuli TaxID=68246 RepID=UPI002658B149|nr:hypothetical protein [Streptomyces olivoreticuli]WKK23918.1 hypothetical protein QZH56_35405 [Streptomyces olivoreticuli]
MRTLFRRLLEEREGITDHRAFLPRFKAAACDLADLEQDPGLKALEPALSTFEAWFYNGRFPQSAARRVISHWLGYSIQQLWNPAPDGPLPAPDPLFGTAPTTSRPETGAVLHEMRRTAEMAAKRARDFAMGAERGNIGPETLGLLRDRVENIVTQYPRVPLPTIWDEIAEAQDDCFRLIESGRARPSQTRELHVLATLLAFHMAKGCHDMGDPKNAMIQARAAGVCAQQAEHPGLIALTFGLKSLITYWSGKGTEALHYARQGMTECPGLRGTAAVWLAGLEARAAALLGDEGATRTATRRAQELREQVQYDDLDRLGGLLTFPESKHLYYTVESEVLLGNGNTRIAALAQEAVQAFSNSEAPDWAFGDLAGAQCNLALTRLYGGELDGAAEAIRPVLDLGPAHRNRGIIVSADRVGAALLRGPARDAAAARDLRAEIEAYSPGRPALPR